MKLTSSWVTERWATAREQKALYQDKFGDDISVREFYKKPKNNPLLSRIVKYKVTLGFNYGGKNKKDGEYVFAIPQETFYVYSLKPNPETKRAIKNRVIEQVSDIFKGNSRKWVTDILGSGDNVDIRGIEIDRADYNEINTSKLKFSNTYTDSSNIKIDVVSEKGKSGKNTNGYNLNIWLNDG